MSEDRDRDGIPDKYDREPDKPARNFYERYQQDLRHSWGDYDRDGIIDRYDREPKKASTPYARGRRRGLYGAPVGYRKSRSKSSFTSGSGVEFIDTEHGGAPAYVEVERPVVGYIIPILYLLGLGGYLFYSFSSLGLVCWLGIGAAVIFGIENMIANSMKSSIFIPGLIGIGLAAAVLWMLNFNYLLLAAPVFVIFIGYMIQAVFADEGGTGIGVGMFLFHALVVTGIEYYIFGMLGYDLLSNILLLGALVAGNILHGIEGGITAGSEGSIVLFGLIGVGIYAAVYFLMFNLPFFAFLVVASVLLGILGEDIASVE